MDLAAGAPTRWLVTLNEGTTVEVWADGAEGLAGPDDNRDYTFSTLVDLDEAEQGLCEVLGRTPSNPRRVLLAVARFPRASVRSVCGG